jgi:hypothetical protein
MTKEELQALTKTLGEQATAEIGKQMAAYDAAVKKLEDQVKAQAGGVTENQFKEWKEASEKMVNEVKEAAAKQGTTLAELSLKLNDSKGISRKSVYDQLVEDQDKIKAITFEGNKTGSIEYMVDMSSGKALLIPIKINSSFNSKAAGTMATVGDVGGSGNPASISQAMDAASILRLGLGAPVNNQFRNTAFVFDLCNTVNGAYDASTAFAVWFDEVAQDGAAGLVLEGATKPKTQYKYELRSKTYKKRATVLELTEEFSIDFAQLESNIMNIGRIDVMNQVNDDIVADIKANATAYNSSAAFKGGTGIENINDYDVIAALAAQVDTATFSNVKANAALLNTNKWYRMGLTKNSYGSYLNPPAVLDNVGIIANPSIAADDLIVGDFKNYNILLRGGMIVRIGYNGTNFAENKFSIVMEQYYQNYITNAKKPAIVKGPDFATIKALLTA